MALDRRDGAILAALCAAAALYAATLVVWAPHPFEDAAILMRYSQHVAEGHGVVWNVGGKPVDGATDFLFMMLVAGLARCGLGVGVAVRLLGVVSHFLSVALVYVAVRRLHGSMRWMAALSAAYLAVGPGLRYASAYFGTPFFALFACAAWCLAWRLADVATRGPRVADGWHASRVPYKESQRTALLFALCGLVMGLIRPEGVFLAAFMLAAVVYMRGLRASRVAIAWFVLVFAVLGGAYFIWRWWYFGHPLPNPFYKKGGGALYWGGLRSAIQGALRFNLPFALPFIAAFRSRATARKAAFALIPIAGFVGLWVLLSDAMNYAWRFQYAVMPVVLVSWPPLVAGVFGEWRLPRFGGLDRRSRATLAVLGGIVFLWVLVYNHRMSRLPIRFGDGNYQVAVMLSDYRSKGYTMAVSEAGLLPFYSGWRAVDTWGLNDPWIAHHGGITDAYLREHRPELIMFHAYFSPITKPAVNNEWDEMVMRLKDYAERNNYILAADFGETPNDTFFYYVRPDFPDSVAIIRRIRETDYTWMSTGVRCVNYALLRPAPLP